MNHANLLEALETVLTWDLPERLITPALSDQALLIAGFHQEESWERYLD